MKKSEHLKTCNIKRNLPSWAKVVKNINGLPIYNMNIFDNIMSWNQEHKDIPAWWTRSSGLLQSLEIHY